MNVRLLRKIQKHILAEPKSYDQDAWIREDDCGTVACIGGWASILSGNKDLTAALEISEPSLEVLLAPVPANPRLWPRRWPEKFYRGYLAAKTARGRARAAVRRIDHFIKTKGAE